MILVALSKVVPHFTGLLGATATGATAVTSNGDGLLIAIVGGIFLVANSVITIILTRYLEKDHHHTRKAKAKTKSASDTSDSDTASRS